MGPPTCFCQLLFHYSRRRPCSTRSACTCRSFAPLLVCDSFTGMEDKAEIAQHSTTEQAGAFAAAVAAQNLVLTHFSARCVAGRALIRQAQTSWNVPIWRAVRLPLCLAATVQARVHMTCRLHPNPHLGPSAPLPARHRYESITAAASHLKRSRRESAGSPRMSKSEATAEVMSQDAMRSEMQRLRRETLRTYRRGEAGHYWEGERAGRMLGQCWWVAWQERQAGREGAHKLPPCHHSQPLSCLPSLPTLLPAENLYLANDFYTFEVAAPAPMPAEQLRAQQAQQAQRAAEGGPMPEQRQPRQQPRHYGQQQRGNPRWPSQQDRRGGGGGGQRQRQDGGRWQQQPARQQERPRSQARP